MVEHVAPQQQHDAWLRLGDAEPVLGPGRRIIDPHHHLWDKHPTRLFQGRYMLEVSAQSPSPPPPTTSSFPDAGGRVSREMPVLVPGGGHPMCYIGT